MDKKFGEMSLLVWGESIKLYLHKLDEIDFQKFPWIRECLMEAQNLIETRLSKE